MSEEETALCEELINKREKGRNLIKEEWKRAATLKERAALLHCLTYDMLIKFL